MKEAKFLKCTFLSALFALFHLKQSYKCNFNIEALNLTWLNLTYTFNASYRLSKSITFVKFKWLIWCISWLYLLFFELPDAPKKNLT